MYVKIKTAYCLKQLISKRQNKQFSLFYLELKNFQRFLKIILYHVYIILKQKK